MTWVGGGAIRAAGHPYISIYLPFHPPQQAGASPEQHQDKRRAAEQYFTGNLRDR